MRSRQLSVVGFGLGLIGSLATVAASLGLILSGVVASGLLFMGSLVSTVLFSRGLVDAVTDTGFDVERSVTNRVANWIVAVIAAALGLLMLAVGVVSLSTFG